MAKRIKPHQKYSNVYISHNPRKFYTLNLDKDKVVYGERLVNEGDKQYREWNPYRSKLAAAMFNNAANIYLEDNSKVLYLGASSGTTVSHVSDIVKNGIVYAVEFSPRSLRELVQNCTDRKNVIPILGDATKPWEYSEFVFTPVDVLYMDVAQPNQAEILIENAKYYLKNDGKFLFAVKARSIDTTEHPEHVFKEVIEQLRNDGFIVTDKVNLSPYSEDHVMLFGRFRY